jgi:hypothetical protein
MGLFKKRSESDAEIDLRDPAPAEAQTAEAPNALVWGAPAPCPQCGGVGYLDGIGLSAGVMYQHCTECFHKYEITEEQVQASQMADSTR